MSFAAYKEIIEEGDTVILHIGHENMYPLTVKKGETFQTKYGALKHEDLIGIKFGSKVHATKGYMHVLHPTPELWTVNLPHRTQILYSTDISMVLMQLDLVPGNVVVESGTGSGSLSHALIRAVAPTGHLYTYEFHKQRAEKAVEEFKDHGLSDLVTVNHRDVCMDGFGLDHIADAVFLDLPRPWEAVLSAKQALKLQGGRICSFSPCIEQVQRVCEVLSESNFTDVTTMECLVRKFEVKSINMPEPDLGDMKDPHELGQGEGEGHSSDVKREQVDDNGSPQVKYAKVEGSSGWQYKHKTRKNSEMFSFRTALPPHQMPGHTGYLTFATLYSE
ncbi:tRNA (adenine(58)-N(1))-methyltransferase catalytic subunit TRMT61A isoform X2 [Lingula anatina]|uniref:tRNA (adenine(58)-N(1))-methyltransferase catalytic subunit TRMT61A n=1 Tax=Lingula anatina TaxID=7574 RepID=A0A1S3H9R5_LINAN|nr:tRNA (adenine(58)-N(1))-methyltransferase catalytic subunit TRMT61A isoform X2 [Lingula anatina]|eukprot:XP_013382211.1 tRNA (adenine(58)-N(1))-methyltransferase catalytic subunit TRMT61A isoform X2 [Lingula anatina]